MLTSFVGTGYTLCLRFNGDLNQWMKFKLNIYLERFTNYGAVKVWLAILCITLFKGPPKEPGVFFAKIAQY